MSPFAYTLGYALYGQFRGIQPKEQQRYTVTFVMGSMYKIDIGSCGKSGLDGERLLSGEKFLYALQHKPASLNGHICRIERRQSPCYLIGIDELTTVKNIGQNGI